MNHESPAQQSPGKFHENTRCRLTADIDIILPKILPEANINPAGYRIVENAKSSLCALVTDSTHKKYFVKIGSDNSILSEIFWLKKARENNIAAPGIVIEGTSRNKVPFMYLILEFVEGKSLECRCSASYDKYAEMIGQELRKLHSISVDGFGRICAGKHWSFETWSEALEKGIYVSMRDVARELFSGKELEKLHECALDKRQDIAQPKFLHGDVSASNFIFSEKRNKIIFLDPGTMIGGDPMMDLAYASVPSRDSSFFRGIKRGYEMGAALTNEENWRLERLRILCLASAAVGLYSKKDKKYSRFIMPAKEMLESL